MEGATTALKPPGQRGMGRHPDCQSPQSGSRLCGSSAFKLCSPSVLLNGVHVVSEQLIPFFCLLTHPTPPIGVFLPGVGDRGQSTATQGEAEKSGKPREKKLNILVCTLDISVSHLDWWFSTCDPSGESNDTFTGVAY